MGPSLAWVKDVDGSARAESMAEPGHVDSDEIGLCNHLPRLFFSADDCPTSLHMKWALSLLVRYPNCPDPGLLQVSLAFIRRLASPRGLARLSVFYRGIIDHLWQILPFPPTGQPSSAVSMSASSHINVNGKPSAANPHLMLEEASKRYERLTGQDLTTHPLSAKLDDWGSVEAVLKVFQEQAQVFNEFHKDHRRLLEWLTPTVRTLITASAILDDSEAVTEGFNQIFFFSNSNPLLPVCASGYAPITYSFHIILIQHFFPQPSPPAKGIFVGISVLLAVGLFPNTLGG